VSSPKTGSALDCSLRDRVWAGVAVTLFEFFAGADGFRIDDAVDGQDAVEVIDFVLQEFGEIAVVPGFELDRLAVEILIADGDLTVAFDLHEDREEAEASVPHNDSLFAALDDFRVDQRPGLGSGELEKNDALQDSELRSGDAASVAGCHTPVSQGVGQILDQVVDLACGGVLHRNGFLPQERVTELEDGANRHIASGAKALRD